MYSGGRASLASVKVTMYDSDGNEKYLLLVGDSPQLADFNPTRWVEHAELDLELGRTDIITHCVFDQENSSPRFSDLTTDFCFGVITYEGEMPLSTCTSVPTEINLELAFGFNLDGIIDGSDQVTERRRRKRHLMQNLLRRKRQSATVLQDFWDRELKDSQSKVEDYIRNMDLSLVNPANINQQIIAGEQLLICVKDTVVESLQPTRIEDLPEALVVQREEGSVCQSLSTTTTTTTAAPETSGSGSSGSGSSGSGSSGSGSSGSGSSGSGNTASGNSRSATSEEEDDDNDSDANIAGITVGLVALCSLVSSMLCL